MRKIFTIVLLCLSASLMWAQDEPVQDPTPAPPQTVVNIRGKVFGGARQADVGGSTFVNICSDKHDVIIDAVYGGNDISGTIGHSEDVPSKLDSAAVYGITPSTGADAGKNINEYNAFVRTHQEDKHLFIGELFGGGYGDYVYTAAGGGKYDVTYKVKKWDETEEEWVEVDSTLENIMKPELGKVYLELRGGTIAYAYAGGDNVTVTEKADICIANENEVTVSSDFPDEVWEDDRLENMGLVDLGDVIDRAAYQFARVFGGNNKAAMAIMPTWHLEKGKIENLYSGGNAGNMTSPVGLLLDIDPSGDDEEKQKLEIYNVYGGCRKADVVPIDPTTGDTITVTNAALNEAYGYTTPSTYKYQFPDEFSARLLVRGGKITNVYGGNDITGRVYGGNAVGVYATVLGDVYGGGNGSYPYTDKLAYKDDLRYKDYYYEVPAGRKSVDVLNEFRPNVEQVSLRIVGYPVTNAAGDTIDIKPTIIHGGIYVGGNSATLKNERKASPMVRLKVGSYVLADNVFLGNNGEKMVANNDEERDDDDKIIKEKGLLQVMREVNTINLENPDTFAVYMEGCAMDLMPSVSFDNKNDGDPATYEDYSTYIGSFYCGGNVGSMTKADSTTIEFNRKIVVFDKVVGGCNNAYVPAKTGVNAAYNGGIIGPQAERAEGAYVQGGNIKNRLILNFNGLKLQPKRWRITEGEHPDPEPDSYPKQLVWNTVDGNGNPTPPVTEIDIDDPETQTESSDDADMERRFIEGHIYGGCYSSGVINGNVVINLNNSIIDRELLFDEVLEDTLGEAILYGHAGYKISKRRTGVILGQQGMDVLGAALNVFGGGKGAGTEIWGSTTINLNAGYTFQIFGGSEQGVIGRPNSTNTRSGSDYTFEYKINEGTDEEVTVTKTYGYDARYSCYVNLAGAKAGVSKRAYSHEDMAECEFMYGGGFEGPICGNTVINLGKGRIFNSFAGSCNADILGHTETYIGRQVKEGTTPATKYKYKNNFGRYIAADSIYEQGFTWVRDIIYGGNDLGGRIMEMTQVDFKNRVRQTSTADTINILNKVYNPDSIATPAVLKAAAYVEYLQGRVDAIFGGCYGTYDLTEERFRKYTYADGRAKDGYYKPFLNNAFVNIRPTYTNTNNALKSVYGAGQGQSGEGARDSMQNRSYVLIDIPDAFGEKYKDMEVFGAGAWGGVGMGISPERATSAPDSASAIIDLMRGRIAAAYGASYKEGFTRRTVVNVPAYSTIHIDKIFGGGYGIDDEGYQNFKPCDAYEAQVNYRSDTAIVTGAIYGGNNNFRRTLYGQVNIYKPVYTGQKDLNNVPMTATIYGAGCGAGTWSQYTEVNLYDGAEVYEVYGGGQMGRVMNKVSVDSLKAISDRNSENPTMDLSMGAYTNTGLANALAHTNRDGSKHNTNVHIHRGALVNMYYILKNNGKYGYVGGYAYGGGLGDSSDGTGDVYGTTYIDLLGGTVKKDLYAAGTSGAVMDKYNISTADNPFIASANAYIEGGRARNVYGGGWEGSVGKHEGVPYTTKDDKGNDVQKIDVIAGDYTHDILGETNVVIGKTDGTDFYDGIPAIERNAYGGGEGGPVYGTAHITLNNGYIGYVYNKDGRDSIGTDIDEHYEEKINDETADKEGTLFDSGCIFGGGYIDNSSVDVTEVRMYGGYIRNSLFGGGEIAAIGRGAADETKDENGVANTIRSLTKIYKAGAANVYLYDGHVLRHVFGGGRGYDNLGGVGHLYSDGYVFGKTGVNIYGGEIGSEDGMANGYGNVFGGGDVGYVYGAYMDNGELHVGIKDGERYDEEWEGYYYKYRVGTTEYTPGTKPDDDDPNWIKDGDEYILTEDCKVLVEPWCKVKEGHSVAIHDSTFAANSYVPTEYLHYLKDKNSDSRWSSLDDRGIIIHNAVFAGGNVTSGSDQLYAEAKTVFGNATASIHDVYNRDLITVGTGHTGGLYGDGNLTFVDGYRGLNITNYGTDFYNFNDLEIDITTYRNLPPREQVYYELRYSCLQYCKDNEGKEYFPADPDADPPRKASTITADALMVLFEGTDKISDGRPNPAYWEEAGVCSRYNGRIMNTIQRADFCGVFGSRMVMQGAKDRVVDQNDKTNYTINRVREVSLNKKISVAGDTDPKKATHGNYFGIYSVVNFLGALTSDVDMYSERTTSSGEAIYQPTTSGETFAQWKDLHKSDRTRNNGSSHNQVALASGVFLELTTEKSTGKEVENKDWGLITGVVELDLINVQSGVGGGFVYAKNEHGVRSPSGKTHVTLTELNRNAVTSDDFIYSPNDATKKEWETSGNFVHSTQTIIDDCYPESNRYKSDNFVKAHYWYIKGQVYVYDQYISAYTGAPSAYSKVEYLNLTIAAASHGTMTLVDVKPNRYAYFSSYSNNEGTKLEDDAELEIGEKTFKLNDPISYWDYNLLTPSEKRLFVDSTYVTIARCKIDGNEYPAGYVMLPEEYRALRASADIMTTLEDYPIEKYPDGVPAVELWGENDEGEDVKLKDEAFDFVFRESNNMSHNTGYMLTYDVTNPKKWSTWYTPKSGSASDKITLDEYNDPETNKDNYNNGPTYKPNANGLYGQKEYQVSDIIDSLTYKGYQDMEDDATIRPYIPAGQAVFEKAYVVTNTITTGNTHLYPGATIGESQVDASMAGSVAKAFVCTSTLKLDDNVIIYVNSVLTQAEIDAYIDAYEDQEEAIKDVMKPAYYCKTAGLYGGGYYETTKNYRGLAAWSSLTPADREHFTFNYDAFDLLIDPTYSRNEFMKYQYDGNYTTESQVRDASTGNKAGYSVSQPLDYKATNGGAAFTYKDKNNVEHSVAAGAELDRDVYESLPNEQHHYALINVTEAGSYYVINKGFLRGETPYATGQVISSDEKTSLGDDYAAYITTLNFSTTGQYYYCREDYKIGENGEGKPVNGLTGIGATQTGPKAVGDSVKVGLVIMDETVGESGYYGYEDLTNRQKGFTIHGVAPIETSTLYVSRQSDIYDLSKEKIITVIYQYDYEESDADGTNITPVSERHVINIHVQFESGIPEVENITKPGIVLPGTEISIRTPNVKPGAFEIQGGGWMLFERYEDTESHINGIEFTPTSNPLYWYQDGYWLVYYAKTYLGKTFSNAVQVSVANYHDIADVMSGENKAHHMYIDNPDVKRDPKIYIKSQDGLTQLKDLFTLSLLSDDDDNIDHDTITVAPFKGHGVLNGQKIRDGGNLSHLEFFLNTDIDASSSSWTSLGNTDCFAGILHGDGHTISGLSASLFDNLCGKVFNLGVTGSFTGSGIANSGSGHVENCWVSTTGTTTGKAVFGGNDVVNSYYLKTQYSSANAGTSAKPGATGMTARDFYNGTVAYNLNGFYLNKRYYDNTEETAVEYKYLDASDITDGTLPENMSLSTYPADYAIYRPQLKVGEGETLPYLGYVENRFYDGDYRYAGGSIPESADMRARTVRETIGTGEEAKQVDKTYYTPIWPDDYLFFGQALNYDHMDGIDGRDLRTHQDLPARINKSSDRITTTSEGNRVYRAPAYFQSKVMGVAHYNSYAVFAQTKKDASTVKAYEHMTAIDFSGYNDNSYQKGYNGSKFYTPLLDDGGIQDLYIADLTRNLLVYTDGTAGSSAAAQTNTTVSDYLTDEACVETDPDNYRTIAVVDTYSDEIRGHWIQLTTETVGDTSTDVYKALRDHLLVDKQDFNCPIEYTFAADKRMWYQRMPERYVNTKKGWDVVSLPFTAELVTTQDKGEITHFYSKSNTVDEKTMVGNEYWLREYGGKNKIENGIFYAKFGYPGTGAVDKTVNNTFLWDYYYEAANGHNHLDKNMDAYQTFYHQSRTYYDYAMLTNDKPYIIGFPGKTFYEFDLSGEWAAKNTHGDAPEQLAKQAITFASVPGTTIQVSDDVATPVDVNSSGYSFVPNYLNQTLADAYLMNADGNQFSVTTGSSAGVLVPFRPYFVAGPSPSRRAVQSIVFDDDDSPFAFSGDKDPSDEKAVEDMLFFTHRHEIGVTSSLEKATDVRIVSLTGVTIASFTIQPGETVNTYIPVSGVYIVRAAGGRYQKKLAVK